MYTVTTATKKIMALNKRFRAIQGGTSAGKSVSVLLYLIARAQGDKVATLSSVVSESFPHLKRGVMKDFLSIMTEHGYYKEERWNRTDFTYEFETGSKIEFFSADSPDKVRGPRRDRLFINECNNVDFETFDQLSVRTKEFIILDWNPTNEFWFYEELLPVYQEGKLLSGRANVDHIIITYKDNEALSKDIVEDIESHRNNKGWWQVYGEGKLGEVDGKIYKDWKKIDEIPHEARLERYGVDFGYSNDPTVIVAIYYWNGAYILDEVLFQKGISNKQIADTLNSCAKALVMADSAEPKSIDEIRSYGVNIQGVMKGKDSVRNGIQHVQAQRIFYTTGSSNIKRAYENYLWTTDRTGKILNVPHHYLSDSMDAIRYGLSDLKQNTFSPTQRIHMFEKRKNKGLAFE